MQAPLRRRRRRRVAKRCHAPLAGAGNLSELFGCVGLSEPNAGLGRLVPRLDMRYRANSRRKEFVETGGCLICGAGNVGLGGIGVGFFGAWWLYGGSAENVWEHSPYRDPRRVGICEAWVAVHGLQDAGLRILRFFVNCRRAADVYKWPPVQAYRNPAPISAGMRSIWGN